MKRFYEPQGKATCRLPMHPILVPTCSGTLSWWGSHLGPEHGQSADSSMRCWCRDHGESCSERYKAVWTDGIRKQSYWHKIGTSTGIKLLCVCIYIQIYIYIYNYLYIKLYYISIDNIFMLLTHRYWWCTANVIVSDRRTHPLRMIQNCAPAVAYLHSIVFRAVWSAATQNIQNVDEFCYQSYQSYHLKFWWMTFQLHFSWLVVSIPLKNISQVSWDDDIPNIWGSHKIPWFQTTNQ